MERDAMHDPMTVAFEIKRPWPQGRSGLGAGRRYFSPLVTIWHVDPESDGSDDSCGWSRPKSDAKHIERIRKLGEQQYYDLFGKRRATIEGKDYAYLCFEPSTYEAVYWAWRAIKFQGRKGWRFGEGRNVLSAAELQEIQELASNPVDNIQHTVATVASAEACANFFRIVDSCFRRFNRPWYRHPRWHIWHWQIQIHPWQQFRRWALTRCAHCGKGFAYGESPVSHSWHSARPKFLQGEIGLYHGDCSSAALPPRQAAA